MKPNGPNVWLAARKGRDGKKTWNLRWICPTTGRARSKSTKTADKRRADRLRSELEDKLRKGIADEVRKVGWADFVAEVLARIAVHTRASTREDVARTAKDFAAIIKPVSPIAVKDSDILRYLDAKRQAGRANATLDKARRNLVWLFSEGVRAKLCVANPAKDVKAIKSGPRDWHWYGRDEIGKLLDEADARWNLIVRLAYCCGLRRGEIENLLSADIDVTRLTVAVNAKPDDGERIPWQAKDHEQRIIPIPDDLAVDLGKAKLAAGPDRPYLFLSPARYRKLLREGLRGRRFYNNFTRHWAALCERAGVQGGEFHALRKSCLCNWLAGGIRPHEVQRLAGHSSVNTTIKYYSKTGQGMDHVRAVSSLAAGGATQSAARGPIPQVGA